MLEFTFEEWLIHKGLIDNIEDVEDTFTAQEVDDLHKQYLEEDGFHI